MILSVISWSTITIKTILMKDYFVNIFLIFNIFVLGKIDIPGRK